MVPPCPYGAVTGSAGGALMDDAGGAAMDGRGEKIFFAPTVCPSIDHPHRSYG